MLIGVFSVLFSDLPLSQALERIKSFGVEAVELGCGGYPGKNHCDPKALLTNKKTLEFKKMVADAGLLISALSVHGNPLHPIKEIAEGFHEDWRNTLALASELEIDTVVGFSGCPGDHETAKNPNWVTCAWPNEYLDILNWQWDQKVVPYWQKEAAYAKEQGVKKIALEMHPGFVVYNVDTLLKLRRAVGEAIGANFDPSHLIWQQAEPVAAIRALGKESALFHFHAKDTHMDPYNTAVNGVLDLKAYDKIAERSWLFRTVGYGHDTKYWKDIISELRLIGYDHVISIEHEDALASIDEGLGKAVQFLKNVVLKEPMPKAWWV